MRPDMIIRGAGGDPSGLAASSSFMALLISAA